MKRFAALGEKLEPIVEDVGVTARRLKLMTDGFDGREHTVVDLAESMGELAAAMNRLRDTTKTATAVGAAVAAAVRAFRDVRAGDEAIADETQVGATDTSPAVGGEARTSADDGGNGHVRVKEESKEEASS